MSEAETRKFFQGSELPRLFVLVVIMIAGMVLLWQWVGYKSEPEIPDPVAAGPPPPIVPDKAPAFESVRDKAPLALRDTAAFDLLLKRVREAGPATLAAEGRRDVLFTHLWDRPERYRGVPIHILGTAMRVLTYESKFTPKGRLYEAWIGTHESQHHPYICIFEDLPPGFRIGPNVSERVVFNGYFLKLMSYQAGDVPRAAPVLIGRLGWTAPAPARGPTGVTWMILGVGVMFTISLFRWIYYLRRSLKASPARAMLRDRPVEDIAPEDLAAWLESAPLDESGHGPDQPGH